MDAGSNRLAFAKMIWSMQCSFVPTILIYLVLLLDWMPSVNSMTEASTLMMFSLVHACGCEWVCACVCVCVCVRACIVSNSCSLNVCFICQSQGLCFMLSCWDLHMWQLNLMTWLRTLTLSNSFLGMATSVMSSGRRSWQWSRCCIYVYRGYIEISEGHPAGRTMCALHGACYVCACDACIGPRAALQVFQSCAGKRKCSIKLNVQPQRLTAVWPSLRQAWHEPSFSSWILVGVLIDLGRKPLREWLRCGADMWMRAFIAIHACANLLSIVFIGQLCSLVACAS